ncbi:hypothetical protein TrLO_g15495 [Triparma laevis f. longispina]|uniref:Uncharacterized protein n=1 Tax=Triparma laevis f. longispina TaxID=1714387 RepID=A0A9W6ZCU0_9STRA|nr:hypothetical protein TrLO_g15495 [Triparma laevis f. longispina]
MPPPPPPLPSSYMSKLFPPPKFPPATHPYLSYLLLSKLKPLFNSILHQTGGGTLKVEDILQAIVKNPEFENIGDGVKREPKKRKKKEKVENVVKKIKKEETTSSTHSDSIIFDDEEYDIDDSDEKLDGGDTGEAGEKIMEELKEFAGAEMQGVYDDDDVIDVEVDDNDVGFNQFLTVNSDMF